MKSNVKFLAVLVIAGASAYLALLLGSPLWLRAAAAITLSVVVPGALLARLALGGSDSPPTPLEWIVYSGAFGFSALVVLMLLLSYLPGALSLWLIQVAFAILSALLVLLHIVQRRRSAPAQGPSAFADGNLTRRQWLFVGGGLLLLMVVAGVVRFVNLGYAEFHGDEARAVLRGAAVIQGYENVLLLHRKGPGEILVPAVLFGFAGRLDEAAARLPFALANCTALVGVLLIGWRLRGQVTGWTAALVLALDGYLVAFARFVQYQSVVILLSVAGVLLFQRLYHDPRSLRRYVMVGAFFLAAALLFHWDALMAGLPAVVLLAAMLVERKVTWYRLWRALLPAAILGAVVVALFYAPLLLSPAADATEDYVIQTRLVGDTPGLPNNVADVMARTSVYNSIYQTVTLVLLALVALVQSWRQSWGRRASVVAGAVAALTLLLTIWRTDWLRIAGVDLTFAPFLLLIGGLWVAPRLAAEERMLWLWFGVPLLASLFAIATPRTHVYIYYVPWALLAGLGATTCLAWLERRRGRRTAFAAGAAAAAVATALFGGWLYLAFVDADREMVLNWETAKPDFYWTPAASGTIDRLYGFPINNGWKAAGALHAQGVLGGDYDVLIGADFVPAWYMRSQERCLSTAEWYLTVRGLEPWVAEPKDSYDLVEAYGFVPWGQVLVNGRKVMRIFSRSAETPTEERLLDTQAYEATFDAAADPFMPLTYPLIRPQMATPMQANFGDTIVLEGFTLDYPSPLHPGDEIVLTLQWRGRRSMEESFKVTNQMYDANGNFAAQRDAMPLCDRRPTDIWYEGEGVIDRHSIRINEDALPGEYILYTALYDGETGARLPLLDDAGQPIDDKVQIAALTVVAP